MHAQCGRHLAEVWRKGKGGGEERERERER